MAIAALFTFTLYVVRTHPAAHIAHVMSSGARAAGLDFPKPRIVECSSTNLHSSLAPLASAAAFTTGVLRSYV